MVSTHVHGTGVYGEMDGRWSWEQRSDPGGPWGGVVAWSRTLSSLKKEFSKETEIVKQIKCLLEAKYVWKNIRADLEWVEPNRGGWDCLYGGSFPSSLWPIISFMPIFVLTQIGTCIFQPRWIPVQGFLGGWQDILWADTPSFLWPLRNFSVHVWSGRSPWPWEWEKCGRLIFYSSRALPLSYLYLQVSTRDRLQLLSLGPSSLLPQEATRSQTPLCHDGLWCNVLGRGKVCKNALMGWLIGKATGVKETIWVKMIVIANVYWMLTMCQPLW